MTAAPGPARRVAPARLPVRGKRKTVPKETVCAERVAQTAGRAGLARAGRHRALMRGSIADERPETRRSQAAWLTEPLENRADAVRARLVPFAGLRGGRRERVCAC